MFDFPRFAVAVFYLLLTAFLLRYLKLGIHREMAVNAGRAIVQLLIMGSLLLAVFRANHRALDVAVLSVMIVIAAFTAARRTPGAPVLVAFTAIVTATTAVVLPMTLLGVFDRVSSFFIPMAGMVIGNAMNATALTLERLHREMTDKRDEVEALLALGLDGNAATAEAVRRSITASVIPTMNSMKTTGLVHIPGLMTGMLVSGADPIYAAEMQAIIIYLIVIAAVLSSVLATKLGKNRYFTRYQALRPPLST